MNCEPEIVTVPIEGQKQVILRCSVHGYLNEEMVNPVFPEQTVCVLMRLWGDHMVFQSRVNEMVTEPGVIVQSDDMQYIPVHLR